MSGAECPGVRLAALVTSLSSARLAKAAAGVVPVTEWTLDLTSPAPSTVKASTGRERGPGIHRYSIRLEEGLEAVIAERTSLRCLVSAIQLAGACRQAGALRETGVVVPRGTEVGFNLASGRIAGIGRVQISLLPYQPVGWLAVATFGSARRRLGVGGTPADALGDAHWTLVQALHGSEERAQLVSESAASGRGPLRRAGEGTRGFTSVVDLALREVARLSKRGAGGEHVVGDLVLDDTLVLGRHGVEQRRRVQVVVGQPNPRSTFRLTVRCDPGPSYTAWDGDPVRALRDTVWFMDVFLGCFAYEPAPAAVNLRHAQAAIFPLDPDRGPWLGPVRVHSAEDRGRPGEWAIEFVSPSGARGRTTGPLPSDALRWLLPELNRWLESTNRGGVASIQCG